MTRTPIMPQQPGHILFVVGEYPRVVGGVGAYTAEVGAALVARGWQVSVVTGTGAPTATGDRLAPIAVYRTMPNWGWHIIGDILHLAQAHAVDLIHVQYQTGCLDKHPAINVAPWWWRRQGLPVAWTYHDLDPPYILPKAKPLRAWARDLPARICDRVIATNAGDRDHLARLTDRLACIPIGSNIHARVVSDAERHARRTQRGYRADDLVVGYFGFVNEGKGGINLLNTLAHLLQDEPNAKLLLVGEQVRRGERYNEAYWAQVQAQMAAQGLMPYVTATGYESDDEVSADLAACDVLFMPYVDGASLRRGTLMAGLAHGCAIVTTTPSVPTRELVDGRDVIFVEHGDIAAAAAAIRRIAHDPALRATLQHHARQASAAFAWESIAAAHERFYFTGPAAPAP